MEIKYRAHAALPSRRSKSGSQKRARAKANLILHPPENVFVAKCCLSSEKPKPARILAARDSALSDSISFNFAWMSLKVVSSPSRSLSSFAASVEVSAIEDLSVSMFASCLVIFWTQVSTPNPKLWSHGRADLLFSEKMLSPNISVKHRL